MHKRRCNRNNIEINGKFLKRKILSKMPLVQMGFKLGMPYKRHIYWYLRNNVFKTNYLLDLIEILDLTENEIKILLKDEPTKILYKGKVY